jgi:succinoglycan biosynthesis transport protein ExoP
MNNLEKYIDQVIEQKPVVYDSAAEPEVPTQPNILQALRRRWPLAVAVVVVVSVLVLPALWLLIQPRYVVTGAIHVVPLMPSILTGQPDRGEISDFDSYLNTQAATILSTRILEGVADELVPQDLSFFKEDPSSPMVRLRHALRATPATGNPVDILKMAISDGVISASPIRRTELIGVTVKSPNDREAKLIVNSFLRNFENTYGAGSEKRSNDTLNELRNKERELGNTIDLDRSEIVRLTEQFGTTALDSRQDMEMQRQSALWTELTHLETQRLGVEAGIATLEQMADSNTPPEQLMAARKAYINADAMVQEYTKNIVQIKRDMLIARQNLASENPELVRKQQLLDAFEQNLKAKEDELTQEFEQQMAGRIDATNKQRLMTLKIELDQINAHDKKLRDALNVQDTTTRQVGQASVTLQDRQFRLRVNEELRDQITRRIKNIEMEMQQGSRVKVAYAADVASIEDKRAKYSAVVVFLAIAGGLGLAIARDTMDKTLQTPDDLARRLDLPVIGTTTSSHNVKATLFAEHLAGDYQTIRTNLSLLTSGGMPKRLAVSSPGMREGKTTFAVNLATSLAKAGKKVLLIDGDLRKPDIGHMLSIVNGSSGLQEVLLGANPSEAIHVVPSTGLHVLASNPRNLADAYELLTSTTAAEQMENLSRQYDHLIVDTPPALAFPDALVWAKLTDAVVLVSFAGQTTVPEMKEAKERFARIRARVLGTVLSNVSAERSLYRSSYSYRSPGPQAKYKARRAKKMLLLAHNEAAAEGGESEARGDDRQT